MKKKPSFKSRGLSLDEPEENNPLAQSIYSQIDRDGLKFLKDDIKVGKDGLTKGDNLTQIQSITKEDLEFFGLLGKGAAGQVVEGLYKPNNQRVAIKSINIYDRDKRHQLMNDIKSLINNKTKSDQEQLEYCPFLVKLYGAYYDEGNVKVVLELMDAGSLNDILKRIKKERPEQPYIEEPVLAKITQQILNGLMYLNIVSHMLHRDIKPANILINTQGEVKLTDFGISKELDLTNQFSSTFIGTAVYMSPERLEAKKYNHLSDIWSLGIMLIELATGTFPLAQTKSPIEILECISSANPTLPEGAPVTQEFRSFVAACLAKDISKRASAIELMMHPWILKNIQVDVDLEAWVKSIVETKSGKSAQRAPEAVPKKRLGMEIIDESEEIARAV